MTIPVVPKRNPPQSNKPIFNVYKRVREALFALPTYFRSDTSIEGILATDIFTLNAAFGATIEDQVVSTLNRMREVWDPMRNLCIIGYQATTDISRRFVGKGGKWNR